jgi:drug/metabolite transporter (DMT)-like permease
LRGRCFAKINRPKLAGLALAAFSVMINLLRARSRPAAVRDPALGNLLLAVAAVSWALYTVLARRATQRSRCWP